VVAELSELTFEDAFQLLEDTVSLLESGDLSVDDMIKKFEQGMALVLQCRERLDNAQARVSMLSRAVEDPGVIANGDSPDEDA
jgi:exodeoxyribonuclease VII small subunit